MEVQIGKYKRPGIFLEEFDNSEIITPTVEGIATMVIGFSKKGPVNRPIILKSQNDLESIFGPLDRQLEAKGSFFHRTVSKMLESSQVVALNLLKTDDTLDTLEYESMSTSTAYSNGSKSSSAYRTFFDTSGFWKKDTLSFLNVVKDDLNSNQRILNFTNMSDKNITIFVFKSKKTGFNVDMLTWFGAIEKVPTYVYSTDLVSDYMIDVVVAAGDWTNYATLSVDSKWGKYFDNTGLRKAQVENFVNDRNVTILKYYQGVSLIPYFRDQNNQNIFVETVVNRDTDFTGLFCAFNSEALETDSPNGLIDIVGNNLINDASITSINYLSYNDDIVQQLDYPQVQLDRAGNTLAIMASASVNFRSGSVGRTGYYAEGFVNGLVSIAPVVASSSISIAFGLDGSPENIYDDVYAIVGGTQFTFNPTASFTINPTSYLSSTASVFTYSSTFVLDTNGNIKHLANTSNSTNTSVSATDIVLGYIKFGILNDGGTVSVVGSSYTDVTVDTTGYLELNTTDDITITTTNSNITVTYNSTSNSADTSNYEQYRRIKNFNAFTNYLTSVNKDKMTLVIDWASTKEKRTLEDITITNVVTSTALNKAFTLETTLTTSELTDLSTGSILMYIQDDEFTLGTDSVKTKNTLATSNEGVIGKYSDMYLGYVNGGFNSGDYFYDNLISSTYDIEFRNVTTGTVSGDYIILYGTPNPGFVLPQDIIVKDSTLNNQIKLVGTVSPALLGITLSNYYVFDVLEDVSDEIVNDVTVIFDASNKHYIKASVDNSTNIQTIEFTDSTFTSINPIVSTSMTDTLTIYSQISNYRQSVEIESIVAPNIVLVNASRYSEVKVGDYLEAYADPNFVGVPKKITRILSKKLYSADTTLVEIKTDATINYVNFGTTLSPDYQTYRFTTVDDYVDTYKGVTFKGFSVRQASMPNGTEERQTEILNTIADGTNLFKAITNKEALTFRYLVDSFGLGLVELSKSQLVDICGNRLDALGILNMPSIRSFRNSTSPTFTDANGNLSVEFISLGGDPESSPAFLYSFADGTGASSVGYFTPYVTVNDGGRPSDVPPAPYVATSFMKKHILQRTNLSPWTVVAGVVNGLVNGIGGLEYDYKPEDIEFLNQMGANPIVTKRNRGFAIETENTAQRDIRSALSFLHVREVLIELEGELAEMLKEFQWKFNTADVRAEIKLRADLICEKYVAKSGIYNFFNKCDDENNTPDIIDNQMGVLDTFVEPIKAMGIIVNNVTILRTGAISSGGFLNQ